MRNPTHEALSHLYDAANKVSTSEFDGEELDIALSHARQVLCETQSASLSITQIKSAFTDLSINETRRMYDFDSFLAGLAFCGAYSGSESKPSIRQALATTEPEPTGMPELHPVAHIELGDDSHDVVTIEAAKAYATAAVKQYKEDAERYRWLRDDTDSDWAICEWSHDPGDEGYYRDARAPHIVDAAIDAAMEKGVK